MKNDLQNQPDAHGHFGIYGGRYVAETLMPLILEVEQAYNAMKIDPVFRAQFDDLMKHYVGRPSPLYYAERLTEKLGGAKIYFKRDELNHTGAHKINNCLGQALLALRMGKKRIIAETGAGQHGVATATVCARFGLQCVVYMGAKDMERQKPNVFRMKLLGAEVIPVNAGSRSLKDAMNEALRDWVTNVHDTYYLIGTAAGPHPFPAMVRDFQSVIGAEVKEEMQAREGRLPDTLVACIGGGSNAIGLFHPFLNDAAVRMVGVEASGHGLTTTMHAASLTQGSAGVLHGCRTYLLQTPDGQIEEAHSISAGLDYPGIGPEHAWLKDSGRVEYVSATDDESLDAFKVLAASEGILPALEPAHALAEVIKRAPTLPNDHLLVMNLCGRGDKDIFTVAEALGVAAMSRIADAFARCTNENRAAFIPFIMGGDPDATASQALLNALPDAGADIVELGIPFSDPMADGPVIQAAGLRALHRGATLKTILKQAADFRATHPSTPLVLMGYLNPVYIYGYEAFARDAAKAGVDGVILVDLPPEEATEIEPLLRKNAIALVRLIAPTSVPKRLPLLVKGASGYLYYVSVTGITGAAAASSTSVDKAMQHIKAHTDLPVCVGFGIKTADDVRAFNAADGVVVGSALVKHIEATRGDVASFTTVVQQLAQGCVR